MKRCWYLVLCFLFGVSTVYAQEACLPVAAESVSAVATACTDVMRNKACYGSGGITMTGYTTDLAFDQVGDVIDLSQVESLALASDTSNQEWAIVLLRMQANLPDTPADQNLTLLAFGDITLTNAAPPPAVPVPVTVTANGRMRSTPSAATNANVVAAVPAGATLEGFGRDETGTWIYTTHNGTNGWISTQVLALGGDAMALPVLPDNPIFQNPMQTLYLRSNGESSSCAGIPGSGIILQAPAQATVLTLTINGADISLDGTVYVSVEGVVMRVFVLEGMAILSTLDASQIVPAGTVSTILLDTAAGAPPEVPGFPQPYNAEALAALPLNIESEAGDLSIIELVEISPPVAEEAVATTIQAYLGATGLLPGTYSISRVSATLVGDGAGAGCPPEVTFTRVHTGASDALFGEYSHLGNGIYGADNALLNSARSSDPNYRGSAVQLTLTSPLSFSMFEVSNGDGSAAYCEFRYQGVRVSD